MSKRITSGIVAGIVALGMSVPAVGLAHTNHGRHKGSTMTCPASSTKHHSRGKHKRHTKKGRGKACGTRKA